MTTKPTPVEEIVARLEDLLLQATTERSHYYVARTCREAISCLKAERARADKATTALRFYANRRTIVLAEKGERCDASGEIDHGEIARKTLAEMGVGE